MHRKMSRIVVLLLVICLTLGNVVPVLAADDSGTTTTVTATAKVSPSAEAEESAAPTSTPSATAETKETPAAAPTPTAKTETTASPETAETTATPTAAPSSTAETSASPEASASATAETTEEPTAEPSATATAEPTEEPKADPAPTAKNYPAAPCDEQDVSGKLFVAKKSADTVYPMFKIETASAVKAGNTIYVTVQVNKAASGAFTYAHLYFGDLTALKAQLEAGGAFDVVAGVAGEETQAYHFTLPASAAGTRVPVCILKGDLTARSPYNSSELELVVPSDIPEGKPDPVPTAKDYPAAPCTERDVSGKLFVAKQGADAVYPMFKIETASAVKAGNTIYVTVQVNKAASGAFTYAHLYFGDLTALKAQLDQGGAFDVVAGVAGEETQAYHFTLPASAAGTRVPICVLKDDLTAKSPYNSSELELVVPADIETPTPVPTAKDYPAAPCDEQDMSGKLFVAKQDADAVYPMFKIETASAVKVGDTIYATVQVNKAASGAFTYAHLYFGNLTALKAQLEKDGPFDVVAGVAGEETQAYHFTLPASAAGTRVPICILKGDLTAKSPYNSSELELVVPSDIPEGKLDPVPTAVDYPAAPCAEQDVSGKLFVAKQGADAVYPMFKIETASAIKVEDTIYVTVQVNKAASGAFTYAHLYFGDLKALKAQLEAGGAFDVVAGVAGEETQAYHFTLPASAAGTRVPVCILKDDLTARSPYNSSELELVVPSDIPEGKADPVPTPVDYPAAPCAEQDVSGKLFVAKQNADTVYPMFKIETATAVKVDDTIYATVQVNAAASGAFTYSYLYFGDLAALKAQLDKGGAFDVVAGVDGAKQSYHFTLPATAAGTRIPICTVKADNKYNSSELELIIPEAIPEGTTDPGEDPDKKPEAAPAIPKLPDDLSEAGIKVVKTDGTAFKMFTAEKTGMVVAGEKLLIHMETANTSFDKLYFGSKDDAFKSPYVQGTQRADGGWVFEFELPASYRGAENPISLGKPDGSWYTNQDLVISIPADTGDSGTEISDADMKMVAAGGFSEVSFKITASSATLIGDTIYCTITGTMAGTQTGKIATKLYIGSRDDKDKSSAVSGSVNGLETTFSFSVSADKQGTSIPIVVGFADGTWDTNQDFFLNIPNFGRAFDLSYYTDGVYDLYGNAYAYLDKVDNRGLPVDTQSTLTVSGDTITIKWVTRASDTDKLYMGLVTDAMATREAQAIGNADYAPIGMNYKVFYITLPKSALGGQIPFVRHSPLWWQDTDGWLEKQDYLVLTDYLPRLVDDTETRMDDAGIRMLAGGSQVEQSFKITSSSAVLKGTTITCTLTGKPAGNNSSKTADKLYFGDRSDKDKSGYVTGTQNEDGTTTFTYTVNAERQGSYTPAVLGFSDNSWDTSQSYFLNVPNFNGTFDASAFTDGVYDLFGYGYTENGVVPVDAGATLTVSGDTITIKYVTRSSGYSKLYFGSVTDDAATRDANAVSAEILNPDDAYSYRYFSITLPKSALAEKIPFVSCSKSGTWSTKQDQLLVPRFLPRLSDATDPDPVDPSDPSSIIKDGSTYYTTAETGASMFKVRRVVITAKDGKYDVTLTLNGTSYDYLYPGTGTQADAVDKSTWSPAKVVSGTIDGETRDNWYTYTITVDELTNPLAATSHSQKNDKWYDRSVTLDIENLKRTAEDGKYSVTAECDAAMFKIIDAKLNVVNGTIMATLTLSGTGYDYLYPGTGDEAANDKDNWAPFAVDENGKYTYTIPVSELDKPITISSHSLKNNIWYDRVVTFNSSTLKKIGDATDPVGPTPTPTPTPTPAPVDPTKPDDESNHETDASGSTSRVNNSTTLKDGAYTPDSFSFSGGSGRTRIVCDKVTVKNGQAYATIRFVSSSGNPPQFSYVKASGNTYYSNDGCTFTIPVELNKNNRILGMTTKMSSAHEIEYIIFVQLKTTANSQKDTENNNTALSTEAPEIMGLTFQEEIKLDHAQYLKLFRYEGNIVLAEIDVMTDTVLDTEKAKAEIEKADKADAAEETEEAVAEEESVDNAQIKADYVSELYKQNILRYLLVPEGTELPAGLEKQLIIVTLPAKSLYVMDETPVDTLDIFEALNLVKVFGAETSENETLAAALADGSTVCGGTWDKPEYKKLVQNKTDLVLTSGKLLPLSEETLAERKETAPADAEALTAVEYRDRLYDLADRFAVLDIPMLIDRSSDEADALAQADWLKLYGILLGDETTADRMIREITSREG